MSQRIYKIFLILVSIGLIVSAPFDAALAQEQQDDSEEFLTPEWRARFPRTNFKQSDIKLPLLLAPQLLEDIPPTLKNPKFVNALKPDADFSKHEPMIIYRRGKEIRAYPVRYLLWFPVINDVVSDRPITVSYNPYTASFAVFSRTVDGKNYDFQYSGLLYQGSTVLHDRQTGSFFLHTNGYGAVGLLKEKKLRYLTSYYISWQKLIELYGERAKVMAKPKITHDYMLYGKTPLPGYEALLDSFYYKGSRIPESTTLGKFERIISYGKRSTGRSLSYIQKRKTVNIRADKVRIRWEPGLNSVHDTFDITKSRDIGMVFVEKQQDNGSWRQITYHQDFAFSFLSFFPRRRILHD